MGGRVRCCAHLLVVQAPAPADDIAGYANQHERCDETEAAGHFHSHDHRGKRDAHRGGENARHSDGDQCPAQLVGKHLRKQRVPEGAEEGADGAADEHARTEHPAGCAAADGQARRHALGDRHQSEEGRPGGPAVGRAGKVEQSSVDRVLDEDIAPVHDLRQQAGDRPGPKPATCRKSPGRQRYTWDDAALNRPDAVGKEDGHGAAEKTEDHVPGKIGWGAEVQGPDPLQERSLEPPEQHVGGVPDD